MTTRTKKTSQQLTREIILREVADANGLYRWACAHITEEFKIGPIRVGGVDGLRTFTDRSLRHSLRSARVWKWKEAAVWRKRLTQMGLIACPSR